jgi:spermidine synthase
MAHEQRTAARLRPLVKIEAERKVLRVGGVIQSVAVDSTYTSDVWDALLPATRPANALILGLGGGTVATLMTRRWGALPITGVERDPLIAALALREFGVAQLGNVHVVVEDAFSFVRQCSEQFEAICVDLYVAGKMAHGVLGAPFLSDIHRLLTPDGAATFNLWRSAHLHDQMHRIERQLRIRTITEIDDNIIVTCAPLPVSPIQDVR